MYRLLYGGRSINFESRSKKSLLDTSNYAAISGALASSDDKGQTQDYETLK